MNINWHNPFSVACAIEETKEEVDLFASPRLPALQRSLPSPFNDNVYLSLFPDPFFICTSSYPSSQTTPASLHHKEPTVRSVLKVPVQFVSKSDPYALELDPFALELDPFALALDSSSTLSTHVLTSHAATPRPSSSQSPPLNLPLIS